MVKLLVVAIMVLGVVSAVRLPIWNPIDEGAHFNYVQILAEEKRLPVMLKDRSSKEVVAISRRTYPKLLESDLKEPGWGYWAYEAFQPPFYYLLAWPVYQLAPANHLQKVLWLRLFNLMIFLGSIVVTLKIVEKLLPKNIWAKVLVLSVFAWPGMVVRNSTVGNQSLELWWGVMVVFFGQRWLEKRKVIDLAGAGAAVALGVVTKFTLIYLMPIWLIWAIDGWRMKKLKIKQILAMGTVMIMIVSPWFFFNLKNFGQPTISKLVIARLRPFIPEKYDFGLGDIPGLAGKAVGSMVMPEEWQKHLEINRTVAGINWLIMVVVIGLPVAAAGMKMLGQFYFWPLGIGLAGQIASSISYDWMIYLGRYLYAAIPAWMVGTVVVAEKKRGWLAMAAGVGWGGNLVLWYLLAGWYYLNPLFRSYF